MDTIGLHALGYRVAQVYFSELPESRVATYLFALQYTFGGDWPSVMASALRFEPSRTDWPAAALSPSDVRNNSASPIRAVGYPLPA